MKPKIKTSFILTFLVCVLRQYGQTVYSYHAGIVPGAVSVGCRIFYTERTFDGCCMRWNSFVGAKDGLVFSRYSLSGSFNFSNTPLIDATADQHLAVVSGTISGGSCDVTPWPRPVIFKFDTNGVLKWKIGLNKYNVSHILGLADSSIVYISGNKLYRLSSSGAPTDSLLIGFGTIQSTCRFGNDSFLVSYLTGNTSHIKKVSNKLQAGQDFTIGATCDRMQVLNDNSLLALSAGTLLHYDKIFHLIKSSDNQSISASYAITSFTAMGDTIYCTGVGTGSIWGEVHYSILDTSLTHLHHVKSNFNNAVPQGITLAANKVNILADCPGTDRFNPWTDLIQLSKKGAISSVGDVGVTSATLDATFFQGQYLVGNVNSTLTVKNFGSNPVQSCQVNFVGLGVNWCEASMMTMAVNHYLEPGDSVAVIFPWFQVRLYGVGSGGNAQFCFYSTIPNYTHDTDPNNDQFCATITVVGLDEQRPNASIKIYPNPSHKEMVIESEFVFDSLEMLDLNGRQLIRIEGEKRRSATLKLDLEPGFYLLRARTHDHVFIKQVVIE